MEKANGETSQGPLKKVMVFCDGTWCGQLTGTDTNVKILADAMAGYHVNVGVPFKAEGIVGCYFDGEGVEGGFADYLLDGPLGGKIKYDVLEAYRFVMDEFEKSKGKCEAWLVGLSRGSYTARCIGGIINNCGLISREVVTERLSQLGQGPPSDQDMEDIIQRAYAYYRDRTSKYTPSSDYMKQWKIDHSRKTARPPVKFMGLFETVGALGIPSLDPGEGVNYGELNFYGKADEGASAVSGEVECVYQALAVHDRCSVFSPCHIKRGNFNKDFSYNKEPFNLNITYETEELWFPGQHYDLGRQKFMFYKSPKHLLPPDALSMIFHLQIMKLLSGIANNLIERSISFWATRLFRIPDIYPNYDFSNTVLDWMIKKMANTDPVAFGDLHEILNSKAVAQGTPDSLAQRLFNFVTFKPAHLTSDAYDHLVDNQYLTIEFVPFAHRFLVGLFNRFILMDRTIEDPAPPEPVDPPALPTPPAPPVKFRKGPVADPEKYLKASAPNAQGLTYRSRSYNAYKLEVEMLAKHPVLAQQ